MKWDKNNVADLFRQLVRHDRLGIRNVQMCQVDQDLSHTLVQDNSITLLHELSDNLSFVILDNEDLEISFCPTIRSSQLLTSSGLTIFSIITNRRFDRMSE
jgi:hypothetical protein